MGGSEMIKMADLIKKQGDIIRKQSGMRITEGKFKFKGKYLYMPGGQVTSIPSAFPNSCLLGTNA